MWLGTMSRRAPGLLVVGPAGLHPHVLGHGDLHVVDVAPVPDRLEDAIGEAEDQDVLDRLLAQVVVDAVDLALVQHGAQLTIQLAGRIQVAAEGLLDDHPAPVAVLLAHQAGSPGGTDLGEELR